jgi:membrane dipeptidase
MRESRFRSIMLTAAFLLFAIPSAHGAPPKVSERARQVHERALLFDGHNDLPWRLRADGDITFTTLDIGKRLTTGQTDIPRAREGGLKAQFWSVYVPSEHPNPARTVAEQIDIVHRMVERYPDDLEMAYTADDVERIVKAGKIASLIGIEGGVAIENDLAMLRMFAKLGARYMTLTHNTTLDWADSALDDPRHGGLSPFGERVVKEMNRLGMLVDISHVSTETMDDVLRVSQAPVMASHSSAFALVANPRNIPDDILKRVAQNKGVVMVNFYSGFIVPEATKIVLEARRELQAKYPKPEDFARAYEAWNQSHPLPRGTVGDVVNHIDHIIQVAGIDHVGLGSDFDGIHAWPEGLDDVSCFPLITEELLKRGRSESDVQKILGGNILRVFREAGQVAARLQKTTAPEVDQPTPEAQKR